MTRFPPQGGDGAKPYDYVLAAFPEDAEQAETLYHTGNESSYVYTGTEWKNQTPSITATKSIDGGWTNGNVSHEMYDAIEVTATRDFQGVGNTLYIKDSDGATIITDSWYLNEDQTKTKTYNYTAQRGVYYTFAEGGYYNSSARHHLVSLPPHDHDI